MSYDYTKPLPQLGARVEVLTHGDSSGQYVRGRVVAHGRGGMERPYATVRTDGGNVLGVWPGETRPLRPAVNL